MHEMAKEKFARLGKRVFMSLDLEDYQAQLEQALSWLSSGPDPREIVQPEINPPKIRLLPEIDAFDQRRDMWIKLSLYISRKSSFIQPRQPVRVCKSHKRQFVDFSSPFDKKCRLYKITAIAGAILPTAETV